MVAAALPCRSTTRAVACLVEGQAVSKPEQEIFFELPKLSSRAGSRRLLLMTRRALSVSGHYDPKQISKVIHTSFSMILTNFFAGPYDCHIRVFVYRPARQAGHCSFV